MTLKFKATNITDRSLEHIKELRILILDVVDKLSIRDTMLKYYNQGKILL
jgi:hypothetical protein